MNLIIVDPILRGSRLQQTYYFIKCLQEQYSRVYLLTRKDYLTDHYVELMSDLKFQLITSNLDLKGEWMKNLSIREFYILIKALRGINNNDQKAILFFAALDDYFLPSLVWKDFYRKSWIKKVYFMRYRTDFMMPLKTSFGMNFVKMMLQRKVLNGILESGDSLIVYDERYFDNPEYKPKKLEINHIKHIPEPWEGDFGRITINEGRSVTGIDRTEFVFLTIGKQDVRKGLLTILRAISQIPKGFGGKFKLHVVGKIQEDIEHEYREIIKTLSHDYIIHEQQFISEEDLPYYFASANVVMLPYSKEFKYTSGVITRAIASKRPIISSSHGLIGYRNNNLDLGLNFEAGNEEQLASCMTKMLLNYDEYLQRVKKLKSEVADAGRLDLFKEKILNIFNFEIYTK
ncbi:glycosyltransferase [Reichenbachiella agariperforans]|uniref:glycosyltransferase n=1 Tax=Reichenbachiella agariperforans TaxID=156994 RepID=UPI001C084416|nr:glycosyltransferase [Reichenbachiella agariperforans]MBU2916044.1 glycosyltransferase [Reichenbachiella agariperforans]